MSEENDQLLSTMDAAEYTGRHPEYLRQLARAGKLPYVKAGKTGHYWMFKVSDLDAFKKETARDVLARFIG